MAITSDIIQVTGLILVALIGAFAERDRRDIKKQKEKQAKRFEIRAEEERLSMKMQDATMKLATVTAKVVMNRKTNGDVEEAFKSAQEAAEKYDEFIEKIASQQVSKY